MKIQQIHERNKRNKRKRQPIGMLGRSSGNHDWLLANASDCVLMETGLQTTSKKTVLVNGSTHY